MTGHTEVEAHMDDHLAESPLIAERPCQAFGFAKTVEDLLEFSERKECSSKVKAKIDGLLQPLAGLRLRLEEMQRLLEGCDSLAVGPSRLRKPTRLEPIGDRLAGKPGRSEMVGDDLGLAVGHRREPLDQHFGDARMQLPPPALEHRRARGVLHQPLFYHI